MEVETNRTLIAFGDSLMKGVILDGVKNRYTQLKNCFANLFSSKADLPVENHASFGCTITKGRTIVNRYLENIPNNGYVAVEFGGNDCNFNWAAISEDPSIEHLPTTPPDRFFDEYCALVEDIKNCGKSPFLLNLPPLEPRKFFAWVSKGLNKDHILEWLGDVEHIYRWHKGYSEAVEEVSAKTDVPLVDIRSPFLALSEYSSYFCADGMHPNEKGHALINETICQYRLAYLQ